MDAADFVPRASGVLVPAETLDKQDYTLPEADFVKMRRLMTFAREYGMTAMYFCNECHQPVKIAQKNRIVTEIDGPKRTKKNAAGGRYELMCGCSHWTIR